MTGHKDTQRMQLGIILPEAEQDMGGATARWSDLAAWRGWPKTSVSTQSGSSTT